MMLLLLINGRPTSIAYCEVCAPYGQKYWHELTLTVGEVKLVPPNFIPSTFNICIKNSRHLQFMFLIEQCVHKFVRSINSPKVSGDLSVKVSLLDELRQ